MKVFKRIILLVIVWMVLWLAGLLLVGGHYPNGTMPEQVVDAVLVVAFFITLLGSFILEYNKVQRTKAKIPGLQKDVDALFERRDHQLEQANKVLDKFLVHEKGVQEAAAKSHVRSGAKFQVLVEERYPELLSNEAVSNLMAQINRVEDQLVNKREQLNAIGAEYNASIHSFPIVLVRKLAKLEDYMQTSSLDMELETGVTDEELGI